jgi:hypothetical protein
MRTKTLLLTAALVAAGVASSMAQSNVYSLNIVGYVNVPVTGGRLYILNNPLDDGQGDIITNVLNSFATNSAAEDGTTVWKFNQAQGFSPLPETWFDFLQAWSPGTNVLAPGTGFFIQPSSSMTITFVGSVVLSSTNKLPVGLSLVGSAYPASTNVTTLGFTGQDQDQIFRFFSNEGTVGEYGNGATYFGFIPGWSDADFPNEDTNGPVPNVGEGFFYLNANGNGQGTELVVQNFSVQ